MARRGRIVTDFHAHAGVAKMPMGVTCAVHRHRTWVPIEQHHVWPLGLGGPNIDSNKIAVCCNGHYEIHAYLDLLIKHAGAVPPPERRHFGRLVRGFALSGWQQAGKPTHGGGE